MGFICTLVLSVHPHESCLGWTAVQPIIEMLQFMNVFLSIFFFRSRGEFSLFITSKVPVVVTGRGCVVSCQECSQLLGCIAEMRLKQALASLQPCSQGSSVVFLKGVSLLLLYIYLYSRTSAIALVNMSRVNMKLPDPYWCDNFSHRWLSFSYITPYTTGLYYESAFTCKAISFLLTWKWNCSYTYLAWKIRVHCWCGYTHPGESTHQNSCPCFGWNVYIDRYNCS